MLKQTISYTDFNGTDRTEDLYFNLTEFELVEIQTESVNGIQEDMKQAVADKDLRRLLDFIKMLVHKSYGIKSADGRHFEKSPEILQKFVNSALYSDLLLHLFQEEGARAEKFITGLMPKDLLARAIAQSQGDGSVPSTYKPDAREMNARFLAEQNIPSPTFEGTFNEGAPIGSAPAVEFQAPPPAPEQPPVAVAPQYTEQVEEARSQPHQGYTVPAQPFRVKETPLDQTADERAEFEAWKLSQQAKLQE